jgi:hypothetical protein
VRPRPLLWGAAAAVLLAAGLGAGLLAALGAPARLPAMNLGAAVVGAGLLPVLAMVGRRGLRHPAAALVVAGAALLSTLLWGVDLEGVRRWAAAGPLLFHTGFLVLPIALAALPRAPWPAAIVGMAVIAASLVAQPDGGAAMAFAAGAAVQAAVRRSPQSLAWMAVAGLAAVAAWLRPDPLPAVAFVEQVAGLAFHRSPVLGAAAILALALPGALLALAAWRDRTLAPAAAPAAGFWLGAAAASLLGNYPTPIVGGGVTPILAYALTWALVAAQARGDVSRTRTSPPGSPASAASSP